MDTRIRLVLLFGGRSAEHDVSCVSARYIAAAAASERFELVAVGVARTGDWQLVELTDPLPDRLAAEGRRVSPAEVLADPSSVVFPLIHGTFGEDGSLQGLLEIADRAYVGAGVLSSALCMDKAMAKLVCAHNGLAQCRYRVVSANEDLVTAADLAIAELGLPLFVKPANMGSSIGISRADSASETVASLQTAAAYDQFMVVEEAVVGQEIEVAVVGNQNPQVSQPGEIVPSEDFYSYADKYIHNSAELQIPAQIPQDIAEEARRLALVAYEALRCEGMARVDFFYESAGRGLLINEVNTIPGFTPISMYPKLWQASGMAYPQLIEMLVDLAVERWQRRRRHLSLG